MTGEKTGCAPFDYRTTALSSFMMIEASAGTGKTYTLQRLVLRLIAEENVKVEEFLIVTFTKAATAELSDRVRQILKDALAVLDGKKNDDELETLFSRWKASGNPVSREDARNRIAEALAGFDRCSVFTIHAFCSKMLQSWAFSGGQPFDSEICDEKTFEEQASDEFLRRTLTEKTFSEEDRKTLLSLEKEKLISWLQNRTDAAQELSFRHWTPEVAGVLEDFRREVPRRSAQLRLQAGVTSYDGILQRMKDTVQKNPEFRRRIREQFRAVLIDEFQDTDSLQYGIFLGLFEENLARKDFFMVLVGDPKQSIYRFRGAEIDVYVRARDGKKENGKKAAFSPAVYSLPVNYRTAPAIVDAVNVLFTEKISSEKKISRFGSDIAFKGDVQSTAGQLPLFRKNPETGKLEPLAGFSFVTSHWTEEKTGDAELPEKVFFTADEPRKAEAVLIADQIASLLSEEVYVGKRLASSDPAVLPSDARLRAGDIALLVNKNKDAEETEKALAKHGIGVLHLRDDDVMTSEEAGEMMSILRVLSDPDNVKTVNTARVTRICGRQLLDLVSEDGAASEARTEDLVRFREAADLCRKKGFAAAAEKIFTDFETRRRLLSAAGGERSLMNYGHIAELLHAEYARIRDLAGLMRWFELQISGTAGKSDAQSDERRLRVESDGSLVIVQTIHGSKGLEYPAVYLPCAADMNARAPGDKDSLYFGTDGGAFCSPGLRQLGKSLGMEWKKAGGWKEEKLSCPTPDQSWVIEKTEEEIASDEKEEIRKAYVAATRASARLVLMLLPKMKKLTKENPDRAFAENTGGIWAELIAGKARSGETAEERALSVERSVFGNGADDGFSLVSRLASESASGENRREALIRELRQKAEKLASGKGGAPERAAMLLSAAESLEENPDLRFSETVCLENPKEECERKSSTVSVIPGESETPLAAFSEPPRMRQDWHSLSYSSLTRGFDVTVKKKAEDEDPEDTGSEETVPLSADFLLNPAFLIGGADTGDAVHNLFEEAVNAGLHRNAEFLESTVPGSEDPLFSAVFSRAKNSAVLKSKVRETDAGSEEEAAAKAMDWSSDRIKAVFRADLSGLVFGRKDVPSLKLSELPEGCAMPELPFSMRVKTGRTSKALAEYILSLDPEELGLPAASVETSREQFLNGYLEGRIDLMCQDAEGRFWLIDWKTDQPLGSRTLEAYTEEAMLTKIRTEKYSWQALIYLTALRRMIADAFGISAQEASEKIGGMAYVFIRGFSCSSPEKSAAVMLSPDRALLDAADGFLERSAE